MSATGDVRSVLIPLQGGQLLLPNATVAEVVNYLPPEPLADVPDWLLGIVSWREQRVPVVSFERLIGQALDDKPGRQTRLAIFYTLNGNPERPYIAVRADAIPHLVRVSKRNIADEHEPKELGPQVLRQVQVNGEGAMIPDLDVVEREVEKVLVGGKL